MAWETRNPIYTNIVTNQKRVMANSHWTIQNISGKHRPQHNETIVIIYLLHLSSADLYKTIVNCTLHII